MQLIDLSLLSMLTVSDNQAILRCWTHADILLMGSYKKAFVSALRYFIPSLIKLPIGTTSQIYVLT